MLKTFAEP